MWCIKLTLLCVLFVVVIGKPEASSSNPFRSLWNSLSTVQKKQVARVLGNASLSKGEMLKKLNTIVDRSDNTKAKTARDTFMRKLEEYKKNPSSFTANVSEDAKAVLNQIIALDLDDSRTFKNDCLDGNKIIEKASDNVKSELPYLKIQDCQKSVLERFLQKQ